ncbi:MAG: AAA family ATPase [Eubacterium sp.]|nr:AAA family ATPase [Eubacterium sp.]
MKLLHCHIENFGKLQDMDLDFREGIHVVLEENGWGKSTLASFLLVMFYGFANEKKRSTLENERKRFAPWQKGIYGGSVTFSSGNTLYRIERLFGVRDASEDEIHVYDAETNLPVKGFSGVPGEQLFSIDRDSFIRTVFISQKDCSTSATAGIQAKIGRIESEAADMNAYQDVMLRLKKETDALTPKRKTGELSRLSAEAARLEEEIRSRNAKEELLAKLENECDADRDKRKRLEEEIEQGTEQLRRLSVSQKSAETLSLSEAEQLRLEELKKTFASGVPDEDQLAQAEADIQKVHKMRRRFEEETVNSSEKHKKNRFSDTVISGTVFTLFAAAVLCFFFWWWLSLAFAVAGVIVMIVVLRHDKKTGRDRIERIDTNQSHLPGQRSVNLFHESDRAFLMEIEEMEEDLYLFLKLYDPEISKEDDLSAKLQQLRYDKKEYLDLTEKSKRAKSADAEYRQDVEDMQEIIWRVSGQDGNQTSQEEILRTIAAARKEAAVLETGIRAAERQIDSLREEIDGISDKEEHFVKIQKEIFTKRKKYDIILKTSEYLSAARASFTARYMEPIKSSFDRYYAMLTGGDGQEYQLDADLNLTVREYGAQRDTDFLSEGYRDLVGLCRRMAMIEAMYENEKPFLIFDDPFNDLDEAHLEKAKEFLGKISESYQVIYLTCHKMRVS